MIVIPAHVAQPLYEASAISGAPIEQVLEAAVWQFGKLSTQEKAALIHDFLVYGNTTHTTKPQRRSVVRVALARIARWFTKS